MDATYELALELLELLVARGVPDDPEVAELERDELLERLEELLRRGVGLVLAQLDEAGRNRKAVVALGRPHFTFGVKKSLSISALAPPQQLRGGRTESAVPAGARLRGLLDADADRPLDPVRADDVRVHCGACTVRSVVDCR